MRKNNVYSILTVFLSLLFIGCGDADVNDPRGVGDIPAKIDIHTVRVENYSGRSYIFYERPDDRNLKYIQAVYNLEDGTERKFNASYFTDSISVDGFPKEGEYEIKLYSVSYAEKRSEPVIVKVNPEQPPYQKILANCEVEATFSGIRFLSTDEIGSDLSVIFLKQTGNQTWEEIGAYYTRKAKKLQHVIRGMKNEETNFAIYATDKWGHKSDTTYVTLTPWHEIEIPKKNPLWKSMNLPGDAKIHSWSGSQTSVEALWDGITIEVSGNAAWEKCFHTVPGGGLPASFTVDLGARYIFSRVVFHWRAARANVVFTTYCPKTFEIYGSNNPTLSGEWENSWTKIETFSVLREDGSQTEQSEKALTANEKTIIAEGFNFDFPFGIEAYRYIRVKWLNTYGGSDYVAVGEMTLHGQEPEE